MVSWMKYIPRNILETEGPLLTTELASIMSKKHHVSMAAAKKGIERAFKKGTIKRIEFMTFGRGERLYYSENTNQLDLQLKALKAIENRRPIIYRLWRALQKEKMLPQRDGLKITGLPTKRRVQKESYKDIVDYLTELRLVSQKRIAINDENIGFIVRNTQPPITEAELRSYARELISKEQIVRSFLHRWKSMHMVKKVGTRKQISGRIFDAVGKAVSRRHMIVVFDFNLIRTTEDYDIEGLLDRIYSVFRKRFKQVVITYCISREFTKAAQQKAVTGRLKQINLVQVKIEKGLLVTKKIDGISRQSRGELFENQIRYILRQIGFQDVQRGLKIYKSDRGLTEKPTMREFTDIDIIARSEKEKKVIICELKNWYTELPQKKIEEWVQDKLNALVDYLRKELNIQDEIEAWYIVSKKPASINEDEIVKKCKCNIKIFSKLELIDNVLSKKNPFVANELRPIVL